MTKSTQLGWHFPHLRKFVGSCCSSGKIFVTLLFVFSFFTKISAQNISTSFTQGANENPTLGQIDWINSILQNNNSRIAEGMSTLQRVMITGITPTCTRQSLIFKMEANKGGYHAYDFITSWQQALDATTDITGPGVYPASTSDPAMNQCGDLATGGGGLSETDYCNLLRGDEGFHTQVFLPIASNSLSEDNLDLTGDISTTNQVIASYESAYGPRYIDIYTNAPLTGAAPTIRFVKYEAGEIYYELQWESCNSTAIMVEFAAHVAISQSTGEQLGYGLGRGASNISGGPYHVTLVSTSTGNLGAQDNQLQGSDVVIQPHCNLGTLTPICAGNTSGIQINAHPSGLKFNSQGVLETGFFWSVISGPGSVNPTNDSVTTLTPTGAAGVIQIMFIVHNGDLTDTCYTSLTVNAAPAGGNTSQTLCATAAGTATFNLTSVASAVINGTGATISGWFTAYNSGTGAFSGAIATPASYTNTSNGQVVYARLVGTAGCIGVGTDTLKTNPKPDLVTHNPSAVCAPNTVNLTLAAVTAGSTLNGATLAYYTSINPNVAVANPAAVGAGTYTIIATTTAGCSDTATVTVTVNPKPDLVTHNPSAVCAPNTVNLTLAAVTAGSTLNGATLAYYTSINPNVAVANPAAVGAGTYTIIATTTAGCSDTATVTVTVNPKPDLVTHNPSAVCAPATVNLTLAAVTAGSTLHGATLAYYTSLAPNVAVANPAAVGAGTYTIIATTTAGCSDTATVTVTVNPKPNLVTNNPGAVCAPNTVNLTAAAITAGSTLEGATLAYYTSLAPNVVVANPAAVGAGTYTIIATTTAGCSDTATVTVMVNPKPDLVTNNPSAVCAPNTVNLTAAAITAGSTLNGASLAYYSSLNPNVAVPNPAAVGAGTYYIIAGTGAGCADTATVTVTVNPKPDLVTHNPSAVCAPNTVNLTLAAVTAGSTLNGATLAYYTSLAPNVAVANPAAVGAGTYTIIATTTAGCSDTATVTVTVNPKPDLVVTNPAEVCDTTTVDLTAAAVTAGSTLNGATLAYYTSINPNVAVANPAAVGAGTYTIIATTTAGCSDTATVTVTTKPCGVPICSYTQGYWGNKNGLARMDSLFNAYDGDIIIGDINHLYLRIPTTGASAISLNSMMPGGSTAGPLTVSCPSTASWVTCMGTNYLTKQKKINNVLLSQTIALTLNVLNDPSLGTDVPLSACFITSRDTFYLAQAIVDHLGAGADVNDLLALANWALSGQALPDGITYSMINAAVDAFNNAFDECQMYLGTNCLLSVASAARMSTGGGEVDQIAGSFNVKAFPNPFNDRIRFNIESSVSGKGSLVVYNMLGQKVKTVFDGYVFAGRGQVVDFTVPASAKANLIYILTINGKQRTGKLINQRR